MRTICPHCNTPNRPLAKFCLQCVTPLPAATVADEPDATFDHEQTIACTRADGFTELTDGRNAPRPSDFSEHALPVGTLIEGFRILKPIGEGGFGIVYLAWDCALERHVAIKEYMPASLAVRSNSLFEVSARSERDRGTFDAGLKSFVNEARLLARFDHPALVKVLRFWEGNRTAYMAMPYYEGPTLKTVLAAPGPPPSEEQLRIWLRPLLVALATIHRENCYHRDISPDNILLTHSGPVLLDFGAARRVITDMTQALTAVLKPGFAPIEQYGGEMMQGPWTDLYALAGVVHYAITGRPPLASAVRIVNDTHRPLAVARAGHYSDSFLRAIDAALSVRPEGRPQDVAQFCALLGESPPADNGAPISRPAALPPATPTVRADPAADTVTSIEAYPSIQREVPLTLRMPTRAEAAQARGPAASKRSRALVIASLLAVVVGAGAWRMSAMLSTSSTPSAPSTPAESLAATTPAAVPAPAPASGTALASAAASATVPAPAPAPASASAPAQAPVLAPVLVSIPAPAAAKPAPPAVASVRESVSIAPKVADRTADPSTAAPAPVPSAKPARRQVAAAPEASARASGSASARAPERASAPEPATAAAVAAAPARRAKPDAVAAAPHEAQKVASIAADSAPPPNESVRPQRCGDLVLKSSLEALNAAEFAYLKKECR